MRHNPVIGTRDPLKGIDTSRERVLTDAELRRVWRAVDDGEFATLIKLLVLTGLRRDELGKLRWSEIDGNTITIHSERAKKHRTHFLTLPPMATEILDSIPRRPNRDYVFGKFGHGFTRWATYMDELRERLGDMPHWQLHDLRRTFRTGLGKLGIPPLVAELAINHQKKGLIGVYDRHQYQAEVAAALARWADHVESVIDDRKSNVVSMTRA
jgi:integrase